MLLCKISLVYVGGTATCSGKLMLQYRHVDSQSAFLAVQWWKQVWGSEPGSCLIVSHMSFKCHLEHIHFICDLLCWERRNIHAHHFVWVMSFAFLEQWCMLSLDMVFSCNTIIFPVIIAVMLSLDMVFSCNTNISHVIIAVTNFRCLLCFGEMWANVPLVYSSLLLALCEPLPHSPAVP